MKWSLRVFFVALFLFPAFSRADKPWKASETITSQTFKYGAFEARIRAVKGGGLITPFFLYKDGSENAGGEWEELDFEVFGRDGSFQSQIMTPGKTSGSNRTEHVAMHYPSTPAYDRFNTYRIEWTPDSLCFYYNGRQVRKETDKVEFAKLLDPAKTEAMRLRVSNWGGNWAWSGAFDSTAVPASVFTNWVQVYSYTPGTGPGGSNFTPLWRDDFDTYNSSRWWQANWTFDYAINDYVASNATVRDGMLQEVFTHWTAMGQFLPTPTDDGLLPPLVEPLPVDSTPVVVPGTLALNKFVDSYDKSVGNAGSSACRSTSLDVDMKPDEQGVCYVSHTDGGEWLDYRISVPTTGAYDIALGTGTTYTGRKIRVLIDGTDVGVSVEPAANGWTGWSESVFRAVSIASGTHTLRVLFETGNTNLKSIAIRAWDPVVVVPGRIPVDNYYSAQDVSTGNAGSSCRLGDVDLQGSTDMGGGCNIGWTDAGEWVEYLAKFPETGWYSITSRLASYYTGRTIRLSIDGIDAGSITSPDTGWRAYGSVTSNPIAVSAGTHRIRVTFTTGNTNFHFLEVARVTGLPPEAPTNLVATAGVSKVDLTWNASLTATAYRVLRGDDTIAAPTGTSYTDLAVTNGVAYTYSVVAVNSKGLSPRSLAATATPKAPEAPDGPTGLLASAGDGKVDLSWAASGGATSYNVYRSTDAVNFAAVGTGIANAQYLDLSVSNGTTYQYYVTSLREGTQIPESKPSLKVSATPQAEVVPAIPTGFAATPGDGQVSLSWVASANAKSYEVYRAVDAGPYERIASGVTAIQFVDHSVVNRTSYNYYVVAVNVVRKSGSSDPVSATPDFAAPPKAALPTAIASEGRVSLSWTRTVGASSYSVVRTLGTDVPVTLGETIDTFFVDSSVLNGKVYSYTVAALNGPVAGPESDPVTAAPDFLAPSVPTGLVAVAGNGTVSLSWTAGSHDASYRVYRTSGGSTQLLGSTALLTWADATVENGTSYTYTVSGVNGTKESAPSASVVALPGAAPSKVVGLTAVAAQSKVDLSWTASAGATSYKLFRSTGGASTLIATLAAATYSDIAVTNGVSYSYTVVSLNSFGEASPSDPVVAVPDYLPPAVPSGLTAAASNSKVTLSWVAGTNDVAFNVYRAAGSAAATLLASGVTTASYSDLTAVNGTTYSYKVTGTNGTKESLASAVVQATPKGDAPAAVVGLVAVAGNASVSLTWTGSTGATGYKVVRGADTIATVTVASYADSKVVNGTAYSYKVVAFNTWGAAAASASVTATPSAPSISLKAQYKAGTVGASTNGIRPLIQVVNTGSTVASLAKVTVRYWFTNDGTQAANYWCDWAMVGTANVVGTFKTVSPAKTGADRYLELSFKSAAGNLAAGASTGEIQSRFSKSDWSNFNQSNDVSYDGTKSSAYSDWNRVTVYYDGVLVWGVEP